MAASIRAVLFDVDGVLTLTDQFFSQAYARSRGMDHRDFESFFKEQFPAARVGRADLKDLIAAPNHVWQWDGEPDELLEQWFKTEDVPDEALLAYIQEIRARNIPCYVATNQERYRGEYLRNVMLAGRFDGYYISADLGTEKPEPGFFRAILDDLLAAGIDAGSVAFFDDTQANVDAALGAGLRAHRYTSIEDVRAVV